MEIEYIKGDIFSAPLHVPKIVTVNTVGVMGKGLALDFAKTFKYGLRDYQKYCREGFLKEGGDIQLWSSHYHFWGEMIIFFTTKEDWRNPSKLEWIERGLERLVKEYINPPVYPRITSELATGRLGCGNGGLTWEEVLPVVERILEPFDIKVKVFEK